MAATSRSISYDSVLSSCMEAFLGKDPTDQIFKDHVLLAIAKDKGLLKAQNGGERIRCEVEYGKNSTVSSYTSYDQVDTTPQDPFTTNFFTWRQLAASVTISGLEETQNRGEHAIFSLLEGKLKNTLNSMREELNLQLLGKTVASSVWSAGTGKTASTTSTDIDPIPAALSLDPTASRDIGIIDPSTNDWFRPFALDMDSDVAGDHNAQDANDVTTYAELINYLNKLYMNCSRGGGGKPNLMLASQAFFELVEAAMRDKTRYTQQSEGSVAFDNIMYKTGCPIYWDEMMPDISNGYRYDSASYAKESCYVLNTNFMNVVFDPQHNFAPTPFVQGTAGGQDAKTSLMLWYGNLVWSALRKHGVAYGLDPSIAS